MPPKGAKGEGRTSTPCDTLTPCHARPCWYLATGTFHSLKLDLAGKSLNITFASPSSEGGPAYSTRRLRADKMSSARPGTGFGVGALKKTRGAFEVPVGQQTVLATWQ